MMTMYDNVIMRTIIEVPDEVIKSLDQIGKQQQKSRAAIIREAISAYLQQKTITTSDEAFGIWKGKKKDGLQYQKELRSEWDKE